LDDIISNPLKTKSHKDVTTNSTVNMDESTTIF